MGIFSRKKKIYVSSVTYNLAGDEADAVNYLQLTVNQSILNNTDIAETIRGSYINGQGIKYRNAYNYARDFFSLGLPYSEYQIARITTTTPIREVIEALHPEAEYVTVLGATAGTAEYEWWAKKYLIDNYKFSEVDGQLYDPPSGVEQTAGISYDISQSDVITITFTNADDSEHQVSFTPTDFEPGQAYLKAVYLTFEGVSVTTNEETRASEPSDVDGTTTSSVGYWEEGEYHTAVTTVVTEVDTVALTTKITTTIAIGKTSFNQYFLYKFGTNVYPTLEALFSSDSLSSPYYPSVPLRTWGNDLTDSAHQGTALYKTSKNLLNRMGIKINKIADSINENESIGDIDFAYIVFGVNLNTTIDACKVYIYHFCKYLQQTQTTTVTDWANWTAAYEEWSEQNPQGNGRYGFIAPPATNSLHFYTPKTTSYYDAQIQWQFVTSTIHSGQYTPGATKGDISVEQGTENGFEISTTTDTDNSESYSVSGSQLIIKYQLTNNTWEEVTVVGMFHRNFVYKGKSVDNSISDAFGTDKDTGFILPLNYAIVKDMGLVDFTQMSFNCTHIVFNCYQVVKQKWYQTGIFKVVIVVVAIVITVVTWGTAGPAAAAAVTVATALGTSILIATIILATGSVLAGMIVARILTSVATDAFGAQLGPIVGAIATIVAMYYGGGAAINGLASSSTTTAATTTAVSATPAATAAANTSVITAENVIKASMAVGKIGQAYLQGQVAGIQEDITAFNEESSKALQTISEMIADIQRLGTNTINTDWFQSDMISNESRSTFATRTLLTGSQIAEITHNLIHNYTDVGLNLPTFNQ